LLIEEFLMKINYPNLEYNQFHFHINQVQQDLLNDQD
jgi:hypothetical protein